MVSWQFNRFADGTNEAMDLGVAALAATLHKSQQGALALRN
jgi:hypothetical protein